MENDYETEERNKKSFATLQVCKIVRNAKKDSDDIDKNRNQIRAISNFLQSIIQLPATPDTVAVNPAPNLRDSEYPFVKPKRTIRHESAETPFSDIKDEEEVEGMMMTLQGEELMAIWLVLT